MLLKTFYEQYGPLVHTYYRHSEYAAFVEWCQALPGIINTCYYYNRSAIDDAAGILDDSVFDRLKRTAYTPRMAEELRAEKTAGWHEAVRMIQKR